MVVAPSAPAPATNGSAAGGSELADFRLDPLEDALAAFARGEIVVAVDSEDRENEGDLLLSAAHATTQAMAFIIRHTSGYVCVALQPERLDELALPPMVAVNEDPKRTAYAVTADYRHGTSTGISAHDRALTCRMLAADRTVAARADFHRPGHVAPLRARDGGVLVRPGHTEASVDLCLLAGLPPAGVLCELLKPDDPLGTVARRDDCRAFADRHGLKMISIEQMVAYISAHPEARKPRPAATA